MTENERLTNSDKEIPTFNDNAEYWLQVYFKLKDYEAIGTIEELKALKEKAEPKKPLFSTIHRDSAYYCSSCKKFVGFYDTRIYEYCHNCGQKLDWSE